MRRLPWPRDDADVGPGNAEVRGEGLDQRRVRLALVRRRGHRDAERAVVLGLDGLRRARGTTWTEIRTTSRSLRRPARLTPGRGLLSCNRVP